MVLGLQNPPFFQWDTEAKEFQQIRFWSYREYEEFLLKLPHEQRDEAKSKFEQGCAIVKKAGNISSADQKALDAILSWFCEKRQCYDSPDISKK